MSYELIKSTPVYQGKLLKVQEDIIKMPDGKEAVRETVFWKNACAILPVDDEGNILFVRQYRHSFGEMILEIPAGKIEDGEEPLNCALRELAEETGFVAGKMTFLCEVYTAVAYSAQRVFLFEAQDLTAGEQNPDEDEFITLERYQPEEAVKMIAEGKIKDAKTITAILMYQNRHK
jgi:ADP-ribose pyrophosphatase